MKSEAVMEAAISETTAGSISRHGGRRVAFLLPSLEGGGAERTVVKMLREMSAAGIESDLVVAGAHGLYRDQLPEKVRLVDLRVGRVAQAVLPLAHYLRQSEPPVLISNMTHINTVACLAKAITRSRTEVICVEHCQLGVETTARARIVQRLAQWLYPGNGTVVAVSQGVAQSLENAIRKLQGKVTVIYPPVVDEGVLTQAEAPLDHPWFRGEIPVFLAVGRLSDQKDFSTLLDAFHRVRSQRVSRLVILGEGTNRAPLEAQASALGLSEDVAMPGFAANPYAYMSRASAFVLSSRFEGMPAVLIEAMACGCPVVATDCPSGPREILDGGRFGTLVPVGDAASLASAMSGTLDAPVLKETLRRRAGQFSTARATGAFLDLAARLTGSPAAPPERGTKVAHL